MTTNPTLISHIRFDDQGTPWIEGTTMKVVQLISAKLAYGWSAEELGQQYPHLSMAQIHSALAYYYDHQAAMDAQVNQAAEDFAVERRQTLDSLLRERLRGLGKLP